MVNSEEAKTVYNSRTKIYEKAMHSFRYASSLNSFILSLPFQLPSRAKILELGCGTGITTGALLQKFPNAEITGVDYAEEMLMLCRKKFSKITLLQGDFNQSESFASFPEGKNITLTLASYDFIFSSGAVSEYGDLQKVLPLVNELLKEKGIFVNIGIQRNPIGFIMGKLWQFTAPGKNKFTAACQEADFSTIEEIKIPWKFFPTSAVKYCVLARK